MVKLLGAEKPIWMMEMANKMLLDCSAARYEINDHS